MLCDRARRRRGRGGPGRLHRRAERWHGAAAIGAAGGGRQRRSSQRGRARHALRARSASWRANARDLAWTPLSNDIRRACARSGRRSRGAARRSAVNRRGTRGCPAVGRSAFCRRRARRARRAAARACYRRPTIREPVTWFDRGAAEQRELRRRVSDSMRAVAVVRRPAVRVDPTRRSCRRRLQRQSADCRGGHGKAGARR